MLNYMHGLVGWQVCRFGRMMDWLLACFNCCFPAAHFISSIFLMVFEIFSGPNFLAGSESFPNALVGSEPFPNALAGSELGSTTKAQCGMDVFVYIVHAL